MLTTGKVLQVYGPKVALKLRRRVMINSELGFVQLQLKTQEDRLLELLKKTSALNILLSNFKFSALPLLRGAEALLRKLFTQTTIFSKISS